MINIIDSPIFTLVKEVDYIIVGLGLAGMAFCEQLEVHNKSFVVFDSVRQSASRVSGGMYNPVILKRYSLPWCATKQMEELQPYYKNLEQKLGITINHPTPVYRVFSSIEDQNNWFQSSGNPELGRFVSESINKKAIDGLQTPFHYGKVMGTGRIEVPRLLDAYRDYLRSLESLVEKAFDYEKLIIEDVGITYKDFKAVNCVFAEGFGVKQNPFFRRLPLIGNKGEYLTIKAENLNLNAAIKSRFFIIPQGNDLYKVGATFNWKDKDWETTEEAKEEIKKGLDQVMDVPYEIVGQEAGIRPTTGDRRPLLGRHPKYGALVLFNGLATRGIMAAPYLAKMLYRHLEHEEALEGEVDLMRFASMLVDGR